jgi:imidazolonepropionase-like amidohydrolase
LAEQARRRAGSGIEAAVHRRGGVVTRSRGIALYGMVWTGDWSDPFDGVVVLDERGIVVNCAPAGSLVLPDDLPALGGGGSWISPGIVDAHVHLAFGGLEGSLAGGLVGLRDLGAPIARAREWRSGHRAVRAHLPFVAVSGPILTAPGGYPSRSWGRDGFSLAVASPAQARAAVHQLATEGVDLIKVALDPAGGRPVPGPATVRAIVDTAHAAGLPVIAHALGVAMVGRALDAGVDELAHTPIERLDDDLIARIADAGVGVVSTLQTFFAEGFGRAAAVNAAALVAAGVELRYGTDLGNTGTRPGVDPRELDRLAEAGLGRLGALRAATLCSGRAAGMRGRSGLVRVGTPGHLVVLPSDPLIEPGVWRTPNAVVSGGRVERPILA